MGKDFESWLHQQQLDEQFPNAKSLKLPLDNRGMRNTGVRFAIPCTFAASTNNALPGLGFSGKPNNKAGQWKETRGWFYCLPRSRQGLMPDLTVHDKFLTNTSPGSDTPTTGNGRTFKQFLVFDQTGDKTTMMFSSGITTSIPRSTTWSSNFNEDGLRIRGDAHYSGPNLTDDLDDDHGSDERSDMREDSEDINALLYTDEEDDYSDEGEETSTGNSPSTMSAYMKQQDCVKEDDMDEVASSARPAKRRKLSESDYRFSSITYTASNVKPGRSSEYEDDAESSCFGGIPLQLPDTGSSPENIKMKREKIREAVSILQTILPGTNGNDTVMVLDEAINYLKTLKFKAKSLGLSGLLINA